MVSGAPVVPINYCTGPALFTFNLRMTKTFGFGSVDAGECRRAGRRAGRASGRRWRDHGGGGRGGPGGGRRRVRRRRNEHGQAL